MSNVKRKKFITTSAPTKICYMHPFTILSTNISQQKYCLLYGLHFSTVSKFKTITRTQECYRDNFHHLHYINGPTPQSVMDGQTDNGMKTEDDEVITVCQVSYVDNAKTVIKLCGFLSEPIYTTEKDLHEKLKQCPDYS